MSKWLVILAGCSIAVLGLVVACCTGVIRPPRPMFHDSYAAGGFGLVPYWIPNTPLRDTHGQWLWLDMEFNVLVIQATGTAETGRSHAMVAGRERARFRLGRAWDVEHDNQYVTIPKTRDSLIVILPPGKWLAFGLRRGQAEQYFRKAIREELPDLLLGVGSLLGQEEKARFDELLAEYARPLPVHREKP